MICSPAELNKELSLDECDFEPTILLKFPDFNPFVLKQVEESGVCLHRELISVDHNTEQQTVNCAP